MNLNVRTETITILEESIEEYFVKLVVLLQSDMPSKEQSIEGKSEEIGLQN